MNVNITYTKTTYSTSDATQRGYLIEEPCMRICLESNASWKDVDGKERHDRFLKIIKLNPDDTVIDSIINIYISAPNSECSAFLLAFKKIVRPISNDKTSCSQSCNISNIQCSTKGAHKALDAIIHVSEEFFGITKDQWLEEARFFIASGPNASKIPMMLSLELEVKIFQKLWNHQGAMNLLNDLKQKPFNYSIQRILENLLHGKYGYLSSESTLDPQALLADDLNKEKGLRELAANIYADRYVHD